ncbi:hypothetical protein Zmor_010402 [Zophobas morio]|uniref:RRM domain-containing protein n=1 Tax=Zophobas morio TaxID=2755281 RepID=A0AA38IR33_9CUCU|nr:hypothetical protein Zmor_010402 [Zophobas morio]
MYNKLSASYQKRPIYTFEDEPPEKKLVSDGDMLIKRLSEKQRNTKVNLQEQLTANSQFYKSTEILSVTNYTSGSLSLQKFNTAVQHLSDVEKLKSCGLSNEEIELLHDFQSGDEVVKNKHKNLNHSVLKLKLEEIYSKIRESRCQDTKEVVKRNRLTTETTLATKPSSVETKLLKFALENEQKDLLPGPMDLITGVEEELMKNLAPVDVKKIRKKARSLAKQIDDIGNPTLKEPIIKEPRADGAAFCRKTKWDLKECKVENNKATESKVFTCKPQNYYTIRDGVILKINNAPESDNNSTKQQKKLSVEEIKKIPKFENYEKGISSKILFVKNLAGGVQGSDLENLFCDVGKYVMSINVMKGKMRGQAFIEFTGKKYILCLLLLPK